MIQIKTKWVVVAGAVIVALLAFSIAGAMRPSGAEYQKALLEAKQAKARAQVAEWAADTARRAAILHELRYDSLVVVAEGLRESITKAAEWHEAHRNRLSSSDSRDLLNILTAPSRHLMPDPGTGD